MADGADHRELRGPAKRVHEYVTAAIARIQREAKTAVDSAISGVRPEIDRLAREAAEGALAEARAAKEAADNALSQANAMNDETRRLLEEIKRRQAEHDDMLASFEDLDGDGIPDALQAETGTDVAIAPVTAPAIPDDRFEEALQRVFDRVIETLQLWRAEGGPVPVAIPANDDGGLSFREGSPAVVSGKKMRKILELAIRADANAAALQPMVFRTRDAFVAYMEERDEDLREALEGTWEAEDAFDDALAVEVERRLKVAVEEGLV